MVQPLLPRVGVLCFPAALSCDRHQGFPLLQQVLDLHADTWNQFSRNTTPLPPHEMVEPRCTHVPVAGLTATTDRERMKTEDEKEWLSSERKRASRRDDQEVILVQGCDLWHDIPLLSLIACLAWCAPHAECLPASSPALYPLVAASPRCCVFLLSYRAKQRG